ncbi:MULTISPECIES: nuclear transport factor 2 family protein [Methylobacillus]|uniref:Lumazine-binding protein n=2 Tax=Methylobacillus flagellatus (strain ATCC 51484 / DSM 6875 / VKM B-1610 / KT) TaxID=265072 RepID=Q1H3V3_METFK|nr:MULTISPECIES: nuclear transport factor 2 family protein [Methylobacillus]ABE48834.1 hypothetical protein Mfla_0564 [Methylobacillus flagellatus KT]MPS49468.1 nuclear transport factor 2 family protein [Methylobacillus sp.]
MSVKVSVDDIDGITEVLNVYMNAAESGTGEEMSAAFHKDATIFGYVGDKLAFNGPIKDLYDWHNSNGPAKNVQSRITNIDIVGTVAHARVEAENWTNFKFSDLFLLLKLDGKWTIVNKVFHLHA